MSLQNPIPVLKFDEGALKSEEDKKRFSNPENAQDLECCTNHLVDLENEAK